MDYTYDVCNSEELWADDSWDAVMWWCDVCCWCCVELLLLRSWLFHWLYLWTRPRRDEYWNHSQPALQGKSCCRTFDGVQLVLECQTHRWKPVGLDLNCGYCTPNSTQPSLHSGSIRPLVTEKKFSRLWKRSGPLPPLFTGWLRSNMMNIESRLVQETCMKNLTKVLIFSAQFVARSD